MKQKQKDNKTLRSVITGKTLSSTATSIRPLFMPRKQTMKHNSSAYSNPYEYPLSIRSATTISNNLDIASQIEECNADPLHVISSQQLILSRSESFEEPKK